MRTRRGTAVAVLLAIAAAAPQALAAQDSAAVARQLDRQYARFSEAYATFDADLVAGLYTADAFYLSPGSDIVRGRDGVRAIFAGFFDRVRERGDSLTIGFTIVDRRIAGALVAEIGYYDLEVRTRDGETRSDRGKFVVVWARGSDGVWRIRTDGYSGVQPARRPQ